MTRPTNVRVQGKDFGITYLSEKGIDFDALGVTRYNRLAIMVQDDLPVALEQDVVFHEITHAIEKSIGLDIDEAQVNALACGWVQVFRDNPKLLDYFKAK